MEFKNVVDDAIARFEDSDSKSIDSFYECISDALTYDSAVFAVIEQLGSTSICLNRQTLWDYAANLLVNYFADNGLVEWVDC
jgi:hypothetical protein